MKPSQSQGLFSRIDWPLVLLYFLLILIGLLSISGASYSYDTTELFAVGTRPMMQLIWMGVSVVFVLMILALDIKWLESFVSPFYVFMLLVLLVTIFVAPNIKGSHSWLVLGPIRLQPAEFSKIATSLMLAYVCNRYNFRFSSWRSYFFIFGIILLPMGLIVLQSETGSALVFVALFLAFYREGLSGYVLGGALLGVMLFVGALAFDGVLWGSTRAEWWLIFTIITVALFWVLLTFPKRSSYFVPISVWVFLGSYFVGLLVNYFYPVDLSYLAMVLFGGLMLYCVVLAFYYLSLRYFYALMFSILCIGYSLSVSFVYDKVLQPHQRGRIEVALGLKEDLRGMGYNVNQAKIAIGSGGLTGKGFLQGTQTKLNYVPEQDTDFIFCTVGEEYGFVGSAFLLLLYLALILRIFWLAEQQPNRFARIYGNCVGLIFFFHIVINIGMVMGVVPVIGIPLPFLSYGGSSLLAFSIQLFLFVRIDSERKLNLSYRPRY